MFDLLPDMACMLCYQTLNLDQIFALESNWLMVHIDNFTT